jgi:hypothetical protein
MFSEPVFDFEGSPEAQALKISKFPNFTRSHFPQVVRMAVLRNF